MGVATSTVVLRAPRRNNHKHWLFRHPQDFHCAFYNLLVLVCYGAAFWLWLDPELAHIDSLWDRVAFTLGAGFLLGWISGINVGVNFHNHAHRPIFHSEFLNRWFGRVWAFNGGWPAFYWYHAHVVVHHSTLLSDVDWTMPHRRKDGRFENIYLYVLLHWPWRYIPHLYRDFKNKRGGEWVTHKALKELGFFLVLWSIPFVIDPVMGLCLWLFPHWIGNNVVMGSGMYVQHAGCVPKSGAYPYSHSNSFESKFFNLTMFNIGYHIVHHDYERVHWSVLPNFHERMKKRLIAGGAHVVPYGYYHAAHVLSVIGRSERGFQKFVTDQAEGYGRPVEIPVSVRLQKVQGPIAALAAPGDEGDERARDVG
jgi:fatty acid desaturase